MKEDSYRFYFHLHELRATSVRASARRAKQNAAAQARAPRRCRCHNPRLRRSPRLVAPQIKFDGVGKKGHGYSITPMAQERKQLSTTAERASVWSITINNPTPDDRMALKEHPSFVKMVKFQDEIGEEGTPHIQGAVQTTQVRFSAMKKWLPRAHIEVARNKQALLNYVEKTETAVPNTQVVIQADYLSMDAALKEIAKHQMDRGEWVTRVSIQAAVKEHAFEKAEFWNAVNKILLEKPKAVGLFTNPQLERAWVHTRRVWVDLLEKDRQTDRQSQNAIEDGEE